MKQFLSLIFFAVITLSMAQNNAYLERIMVYDYINLETGYAISFDKDCPTYHLLEIGLNKSRYGGMHGGGYQYGVGTLIGLNTENFSIAPHINATVYFQGLAFGTELILYTDFHDTSLGFSPFIGFGGGKAKLTFHPNIALINKEFLPINAGFFKLTINISLSKKRA